MKKLLALLLSVAMMLPTVPMMAFAENQVPETVGEEALNPETAIQQGEETETTVVEKQAADTGAVENAEAVKAEETEDMTGVMPTAVSDGKAVDSEQPKKDTYIGKVTTKDQVLEHDGGIVKTLIRPHEASNLEFQDEQNIPELKEEHIKYKVFLDGEEVTIKQTGLSKTLFSQDGKKYGYNLFLEFPKNETDKNQEYRVDFYSGDYQFIEDLSRKVIVKKKATDLVEVDAKVEKIEVKEDKIYGSKELRVALKITGKDLSAKSLEYKVTKNDLLLSLPSVTETVVSGDELTAYYYLPENTDRENASYVFYAKGKNEKEFKSVSFSQKGLDAYTWIESLPQEKITVSADGKNVKFDVVLTKDYKDKIKLEVKQIKEFSGEELIEVVPEIVIEGKTQHVTFDLPANKSKEEAKYTVRFKTDTEDFIAGKTLELIQESLKGEALIESVSVNNTYMTLKGGNNRINLVGQNLSKKDFEITTYKLTKTKAGIEETKVTDGSVTLTNVVNKIDTHLSYYFSFEPVKENTQYKFVIENKTAGVKKEVLIHLHQEGSNKKKTSILPQNAFFLNDHIIKLQFDNDIQEARTDAILNEVNLVKGKTFYPLPKGTEVVVEGKEITIDVQNWFIKEGDNDDHKDIKIHFPERVIQNKHGQNEVYSTRDNFLIQYGAIVTGSRFIKGEVLDHKGGEVELLIEGNNFDLNKTNAKVTKLEPLRKIKTASGEKIGVTEIENVEVKTTDKEVRVKFTVPENKTNRIESYIVLLSLDGKYYSGEYAQTINDRAKRMVVSVKNEGLDTTEPVLGFARITSYQTNPIVNGVPDSLHTITPINQESKKTFVYLYGMNLDQKRTKIRAKDENGVYFSPVYDAAADSGDRFMLVTWAILGNNNNQFIEIIAPRGYRNDQTYTYEMAVDGKNFNEEITVKATIKYDGETYLDKSKLLCEMKLNFVDEKGNVIHEPITMKGYKQLPVSTVSMLPIEIEGYQYSYNHSEYDLYHKRLDEYAPQIKEGKMGEITYIYKNLNPEKEEAKTEIDENKNNDDYVDYNPDALNEKGKKAEDKTEINVDDNKLPLGEVDTNAEVFDIPEVAPQPDVVIEDVKESKYEKEITELAKYGIIKGMGENKVEPKREVSKAMFVEMLFRTVKDKTGENKVLTDISAKDWFYQSASWASAQGIVIGDAKGNFNGKKTLTAAELAVMMDRFMKKFNIVLPKTAQPQKAEGPQWAIEALNNMYEMEVFSADIKATDAVNREQAAGILYKLLKATKTIK